MKAIAALGLVALLACGPATGSPALVLKGVTVIDMTGAAPRPGMTVIVRDGRIESVGEGTAPQGAQIVNARGKFLIPGLWDMHVHLWASPERLFPLFLANGVTGVRDMASPPGQIFRLREQAKTGLGPRIVACGPQVDGPGQAPEHAIPVANAEEARQAVQSLKKMGADCVKPHDRVPRDAYLALVEEAKRAGLPVMGHVPNEVTLAEASDGGQRSIEHLGGIFDACSSAGAEIDRMKSAPPPKSPAEFPQRIATRGTLALDTYSPELCGQLFERFVRNGTWQVPTLATTYGRTFIDDLSKRDDPRLRYIPKDQREGWKPENDFFARFRTPDYVAWQKRYWDEALKLVGAMHRAGVPILAGTDLSLAYVYPGFSLHDELAFLVEAGLPPLEALKAATINPARFLGLESGTIEPGKTADLVLLDADPLADIRNTRRISGVVVNGRWLGPEELKEMLDQAAAEAAR
ncbi:MAG TPA: amidohydrolase family protein [Thermoanaerobaculia bacterium]|nr:amidohydrolase family protein [Thermoanaerobaculia bacterium]